MTFFPNAIKVFPVWGLLIVFIASGCSQITPLPPDALHRKETTPDYHTNQEGFSQSAIQSAGALAHATENITAFVHSLTRNWDHDHPPSGFHLTRLRHHFIQWLKVYDDSEAIFHNLPDTEQLLILSVRTQRIYQLYQTFSSEYRLKRLLDNLVLAYPKDLGKLPQTFRSVLNRRQIADLERRIEQYMSKTEPGSNDTSPIHARLLRTLPFQVYLSHSSLQDTFNHHPKLSNIVRDGLSLGVDYLFYGLSWAFGKVVGNVYWRQGYLYKDLSAGAHMASSLKPLDILLEKKEFLLSDMTIPGHWGHVAVFLGTRSQLMALNLWNHPFIKPLQASIEAGQTIYEVRRWGVIFNRLDKWMNLDEAAVIRHKNLLEGSPDRIAQVYKRLFEHRHSTYDYNFDALSASQVTCAEIVALSYGNIYWPMINAFGRIVITPENIAQMALYPNSPVELVTYIKGNGSRRFSVLSRKDFAQSIGHVPDTPLPRQ